MIKKILQFYPLYFTIFPTLAFYLGNKREVQLEASFTPIIYSLVLLLVIWIIVNFIVKDTRARNIVIFSILVYFFSYGYFLRKIPLFNKGIIGFLAYTIFFAMIFTLLWKFRKRPETAIFLTIVSAYVITVSLTRIMAYEWGRRVIPTFDTALSNGTFETKKKDLPDIYYIILDRYANNQVLEKQYDFDNADFFAFLRKKDFYIAEDSFANYPKTHLSLASSLNMDYLDDFAKKVGVENSDYTPAFKLVEDNTVARLLKSAGYQYFYFGDWWGPTNVSKLADKNFNLYANSNEFTRKFFQTTLIALLLGNYFEGNKLFGFFQDRIYENTNYKFEKLGQIVQEKGPKFIFVHMLFPHHPYIFDANCRRVDDKRKQTEDQKYIAQLQCANTKVKKMIERILQRSKKPPIIILQSDEGPFKTDEMRRDGEQTDWTKVTDAAIERHMKILNAYFLPGFDTSKLYPSLSPVNTFRLIFNEYFGADFKLLPDKSYFIPHLDRPYQYMEITDKISIIKK
ncbi:MAG TPA: sulfatase-like hydrolase/transferase [Patescibacteria group bacterium]|nr:sulfatase-like hydrolase/transferase [Patescibacteria group bacterium]